MAAAIRSGQRYGGASAMRSWWNIAMGVWGECRCPCTIVRNVASRCRYGGRWNAGGTIAYSGKTSRVVDGRVSGEVTWQGNAFPSYGVCLVLFAQASKKGRGEAYVVEWTGVERGCAGKHLL